VQGKVTEPITELTLESYAYGRGRSVLFTSERRSFAIVLGKWMLFMPVVTGGDWIGSLTDTPADDVPHRRGHFAGWSDRHMKEQSADPMFCWAAYQLETPIYAGHPTGLLKFSSQDRGGGTGCPRPVRSSSMFNNDREGNAVRNAVT
jgi:hypothetical protein